MSKHVNARRAKADAASSDLEVADFAVVGFAGLRDDQWSLRVCGLARGLPGSADLRCLEAEFPEDARPFVEKAEELRVAYAEYRRKRS